MTHRARLAGMWLAIVWSFAVGFGSVCFLYTHQYDAIIFSCVILLITMVLLIVYLWDTVRALGFKEQDTKRYKSEVDFLTAKVADLEYIRRTVYGVFRNKDNNPRGELVSLHEVLFGAKSEARRLNLRDSGAAGLSTAYGVYALHIAIKGEVESV